MKVEYSRSARVQPMASQVLREASTYVLKEAKRSVSQAVWPPFVTGMKMVSECQDPSQVGDGPST